MIRDLTITAIAVLPCVCAKANSDRDLAYPRDTMTPGLR